MIETKERDTSIGTPEYEAEHLKNTRDKGLSERQEKSVSLAMEKWRKMEASRDIYGLFE